MLSVNNNNILKDDYNFKVDVDFRELSLCNHIVQYLLNRLRTYNLTAVRIIIDKKKKTNRTVCSSLYPTKRV